MLLLYPGELYRLLEASSLNCYFNIKTTASVAIMVSVLASSAIDHRFKPWLGQTKDYKIGICFFFAKHAALRRKIKDWLARNQNNVSEWSDMSSDMSICGLLFQ